MGIAIAIREVRKKSENSKSPRLSGSHRSTRIASDLASRALASQAKPQRESESQAFRIAQILKHMPIFRIAGQHRRIFAEGFFRHFEGFSFQIKLMCFRIAGEKKKRKSAEMQCMQAFSKGEA